MKKIENPKNPIVSARFFMVEIMEIRLLVPLDEEEMSMITKGMKWNEKRERERGKMHFGKKRRPISAVMKLRQQNADRRECVHQQHMRIAHIQSTPTIPLESQDNSLSRLCGSVRMSYAVAM